jgi:hypothetical protein
MQRHAAELLRSPVGRQLLLNLSADGYSPYTIESLSEQDLNRYIVAAALSVSSAADAPTGDLIVPIDHAHLSTLAEAVLQTTAAQRWKDPWSSRRQIWITSGVEPPTWTLPTTRDFVALPSKPPAGLWTSPELQPSGSAWLPVVESGILGQHPEWSAWAVCLIGGMRVFQIRSPSDWLQLCERFPRRLGESSVAPDWNVAATAMDGVHLTTLGLVSVQGVPLVTRFGETSLVGWDAESTAWLKPCIEEAVLLGRFCIDSCE